MGIMAITIILFILGQTRAVLAVSSLLISQLSRFPKMLSCLYRSGQAKRLQS